MTPEEKAQGIEKIRKATGAKAKEAYPNAIVRSFSLGIAFTIDVFIPDYDTDLGKNIAIAHSVSYIELRESLYIIEEFANIIADLIFQKIKKFEEMEMSQ